MHLIDPSDSFRESMKGDERWTRNDEGAPRKGAPRLCGQRDNYRTNFDDFRAVYLFGIQVDIEQYPESALQDYLNT